MLTFTCHDGLQMRIRFERKNKNRAAAELSLQRDATQSRNWKTSFGGLWLSCRSFLF